METSISYNNRMTFAYHLDINKGFYWSFVIKVISAVILYYLLLGFVDKGDPLSSLVSHVAVGVLPVLFLSYILIGNTWCVRWFTIAYIIKTIIGIVHYIVFIDPNYFSGSGAVVQLHGEFQATFDQIGVYEDYFDFTYESIIYNQRCPHPELYALMSLVFKKVGHFFLSILPLNNVSSLFSAIMITYVTKLRNGNIKVATILSAFFPASLIPSFFSRDLLGFFIITFFGVQTILLNKKWWLLLSLISSYFFYLQRTPYVIIPLFAYYTYTLFNNRKNRSDSNSVFKLIISIIILLILFASSSFLSEIYVTNEAYTTSISRGLTYLLFPIRYFIAIIGSFPWTNFMNGKEASYYMSDIIFSAALFYITFKVFPRLFEDIKTRRNVDYLVLLAIFVMLTGVMSSYTNILYVGEGILFFVPMISSFFDKLKFIRFNISYLLIMLIFNFLYIVLGVSGLKSIIW